jgi:hypothetical protein
LVCYFSPENAVHFAGLHKLAGGNRCLLLRQYFFRGKIAMPEPRFFDRTAKLLLRFRCAALDVVGPLRPLVKFLAVAIPLLSLTRLGMVLWQWSRVQAVGGFWKVLGYGIRMDMILLCYLLVPVALGLFLFPVQLNGG